MTSCAWVIAEDGTKCPNDSEGKGGYCGEHRREYQRNRYRGLRRAEIAADPNSTLAEVKQACHVCERSFTRGVRKETVDSHQWCHGCAATVQYLFGLSPEARQSCLEQLNEWIALEALRQQASSTVGKGCSRCKQHSPLNGASSGYCSICSKLYRIGRQRQQDDKKTLNLSLSEKAYETELAALESGKLRKVTYWWDKNHNWSKLPEPRVVWGFSAWNYISAEEEAFAHIGCDHPFTPTANSSSDQGQDLRTWAEEFNTDLLEDRPMASWTEMLKPDTLSSDTPLSSNLSDNEVWVAEI